MSREEIEAIAEAAAEKAVTRTLLAIGIDASDAEAITARQADFRHLRRWRTASEAVPHWTFKAIVTTLATGAAGYLLLWFGWRG